MVVYVLVFSVNHFLAHSHADVLDNTLKPELLNDAKIKKSTITHNLMICRQRYR